MSRETAHTRPPPSEMADTPTIGISAYSTPTDMALADTLTDSAYSAFPDMVDALVAIFGDAFGYLFLSDLNR